MARSSHALPAVSFAQDDGTSFSFCSTDGTGLINMGAVAAGTQCVDGQTSAARTDQAEASQTPAAPLSFY